MKVYKIETQSNTYLSFLAEDRTIFKTNKLIMNCESKIDAWEDYGFYIYETSRSKGNFFGGITGALVIDERTKDLLLEYWEASGELLPFMYKKEWYYIFNALHCYDVLDDERTEWVYGKTTGSKIRIQRYVFHPERVPDTPIFKIPQTVRGSLYTAEGLNDKADEFIYQVQKNGLKGILFKEVWSNDNLKL